MRSVSKLVILLCTLCFLSLNCSPHKPSEEPDDDYPEYFVSKPVIEPDGGSYDSVVYVVFKQTDRQMIDGYYFTWDGTEPNNDSPFGMVNPWDTLDGGYSYAWLNFCKDSAVIKIKARFWKYTSETVSSKPFYFNDKNETCRSGPIINPGVSTPSIIPNGGYYTDTLEITFTQPDKERIEGYLLTWDGSQPCEVCDSTFFVAADIYDGYYGIRFTLWPRNKTEWKCVTFKIMARSGREYSKIVTSQPFCFKIK